MLIEGKCRVDAEGYPEERNFGFVVMEEEGAYKYRIADIRTGKVLQDHYGSDVEALNSVLKRFDWKEYRVIKCWEGKS